jgi:hypothetical protein
MTSNVWLIAVVAQALAMAFLHLGKSEAVEWPLRCWRGLGCKRGRKSRRCSACHWGALGCGQRQLVLWWACRPWRWSRQGGSNATRRPARGASPFAGPRAPEFDVDMNVLRQATHQQINLLLWKQVGVVANQCVETLLVVLDCVVEGQPCKLKETVTTNRQPKA